MSLSVAIVGSGPAGFYAADALIKLGIDCQIDLIERLPTPFGLIRGGVAPDHQSTKRVTKAYERTAQAEPVRYFGNVHLGRDLSLEELREIYDAVVLAVGSPKDRPLEIPGAEKRGIIGSAAFVGWYNGHPDFVDLAPDLQAETIAVIGNGNVALDIARLLGKTRAEVACSDITDYAAAAIEASPVRAIHILGRRDAGHAKFTNKELKEMGALADCAPIVDPRDLGAGVPPDLDARDRRLAEKNLATLKGFTELDIGAKSRRVVFDFCAKPLEILGGEKVEALRIERTCVAAGRAQGTGETWDLPCGAVITAIGYRGPAIPGAPFDDRRGTFVHDDGRIAPGLYAVGWCKRGPTGVIGTNKADGDLAAKQIFEDVEPCGKPGRERLKALLRERGVRHIDYPEWKRIEAAEEAAAAPGAPRRKLVTVGDMLALLDENRAGTATP